MRLMLKAAFFLGFTIFALPAYAIDCTSAEIEDNRVLSAVCASPDLKQADAALNEAYQKLYRGRDKQQQRVLKTMQSDWLSSGGYSCNDGEKIDPVCLAAKIGRRIDFFKSADGVGPGNQGRLIFKGIYRARKTAADTVVSISLYEYEKADRLGQRTFNAEVEKILAENKVDEGEVPSDIDCSNCEHTITMLEPFQTEGFISAAVEFWMNDGGAHGIGYTRHFNQFIDESAPLAFDDMFIDYDASMMAKACYDQIADADGLPSLATVGDSEENFRPSNAFMQSFRDPGTWRFDGKSLEATFSTYTIGAYSEGEQSCSLDYETLSPHLSDRGKLP